MHFLGLFGARYQREVGGHEEKVYEGEYGDCILYLYMKIEE
jgi:hypothetical protein